MKSKISFFLVLTLVITSFSFLNNAEARSADEPCSYLHKSWKIDPSTGKCGPTIVNRSSSPAPVQNYASNNPTNTFQQINCGEGTILKNNLCVVDFRREIAAQTWNDDISDAFLPVTNLFDNMPDFPKIDPMLIAFLSMIFIASIFIGRQFSRKKRISRRNNRRWGNARWGKGGTPPEDPGAIRVSPAEYKRMQEFERSFATVGKSDPEYFLHVISGAELIDASRRGNELYSISTIIRGRSLKILKYRDPSTNQLYISFVPDYINEADHGMAWKFDVDVGDYRRTKGNEG